MTNNLNHDENELKNHLTYLKLPSTNQRHRTSRRQISIILLQQ